MSRSIVRHEERRLRRIFKRIVIFSVVVPPTVAVVDACSSSSTTMNEQPDGATDASIVDAAADDASDGGISDAQVPFCAPTNIPVDASNPDGGIECGIFEKYDCRVPADVVPRSADCYFDLNDCPQLCPGIYFFNCRAYGNWCQDGAIVDRPADGGVRLDDGGTLDPTIIDCQSCPNGSGRRPSGLVAAGRSGGAHTSALGMYFAEMSHLEEASVFAFRSLESELASHGAPGDLVVAAKNAADDEVRHALETARLARRYGATPPSVVVTPCTLARSLEAIALENAVEGCVRETFGALVATWQAVHAEDADVAASMQAIAKDETRHAALAWGIATWAKTKLDQEARARVDEAVDSAVRELEADAARAQHPDVVRAAGVPSASAQVELIGKLRHMLWS